MNKFKITAVRIKFEVRDMWIGLYWNYVPRLQETTRQWDYDNLLVYICFFPMFPIVINIRELESKK